MAHLGPRSSDSINPCGVTAVSKAATVGSNADMNGSRLLITLCAQQWPFRQAATGQQQSSAEVRAATVARRTND